LLLDLDQASVSGGPGFRIGLDPGAAPSTCPWRRTPARRIEQHVTEGCNYLLAQQYSKKPAVSDQGTSAEGQAERHRPRMLSAESIRHEHRGAARNPLSANRSGCCGTSRIRRTHFFQDGDALCRSWNPTQCASFFESATLAGVVESRPLELIQIKPASLCSSLKNTGTASAGVEPGAVSQPGVQAGWRKLRCGAASIGERCRIAGSSLSKFPNAVCCRNGGARE
jgi:hypothetical protein